MDLARSTGRVLMIVPTYQEAANLAWLVGRLRAAQPGIDVLVVDDASPDGTGLIADDLAARDEQVMVLHRSEKGGLGAAYLAGFRWALSAGYAQIGEMDADGSHQPEQLYRLLDAVGTADVVIGSRWIPGGSIVNWPLRREVLSRAGNLYLRRLLGIPVRDGTAGYRVFRREALEALDLDSVRSSGYVFQADVVVRCFRAGLLVREVPIDFVERQRGASKMSSSVAVESLYRITAWGVGERSRLLITAVVKSLSHLVPGSVDLQRVTAATRARWQRRRRSRGGIEPQPRTTDLLKTRRTWRW